MDTLEFISTTIGEIAWPAAITYGVYVFRDEIAKLLPNLKVKHNDTEVSFRQEIQEDAQPRIEAGLGKAVPLDNVPSTGTYATPPVAPVKLQTVENLKVLISDQLKSYDPNEHVSILVNEVAVAQVSMGFEVVFADIFESQIKFLRLLNARKDVSTGEANNFFVNIAQSHEKLAEWDVHKWMNYLIRFKLIEELGEIVKITDMGSDFLTYIDLFKPGYSRPL